MLKKLTATGVLTFAVTGAVMAAAAPANADVAISTGDVLSGTQVTVPVTACGNEIIAVPVLNGTAASCGDVVGGTS